MNTPWNEPEWHARAEIELADALGAVGRAPSGPATVVKAWGRSCIRRVPTERAPVWIKHSYRLPPGEEVVLSRLAPRWADRLPCVVATWPGAVAMEPLAGVELTPEHPCSDWVAATTALAELQAGEAAEVGAWLDMGVRDRRPETWPDVLDAFFASPIVEGAPDDAHRQLERQRPELVARYAEGFGGHVTLVPQDSGCCNIHVGPAGPIFYDWADVVIGHPFFSCDRLLDQTPTAYRDAVIAAFCAPLGLTAQAFGALRRFNVLHEAIRYHDELAYLDAADPIFASHAAEVRRQVVQVAAQWR